MLFTTRSGKGSPGAAVGGVLAGLAVACGASAQDGQTNLMLTAQVRDFPPSHPDFCKTQNVGRNWVEGSVSPTLGPTGRPVYTAQGHRLVTPGLDASGNQISGAMINETPELPAEPAVVLRNPPVIANNAKIDSYDPAIGPYGGSNVGSAPTIGTGQPMPEVIVPSIPTYIESYIKDGNAASTLNKSFRCQTFAVRNSHRLTIQGKVTIVASELFAVENFSRIEMAPGARLIVYALKDVRLKNNTLVNMNTWDASRFALYYMGSGNLDVQESTRVCGTIICPDGRVVLNNNCDFYGWITSEDMSLSNNSGLHVPAEPEGPACAVHIDDTPPVLGAPDTAGVTSPQSFGQWFQDTVGVNESAQERLLFSMDETGAWEFEADDFRPIDGQLLSEGQAGANRNFTLDLDGQFKYSPCTGQFFEFGGDGDALVYVDGRLVLELTGNNAGVEQRVDLDRLNLNPNTTHHLQFFYAQRSCSPSNFHVRTSITLDTTYRVEKSGWSNCD